MPNSNTYLAVFIRASLVLIVLLGSLAGCKLRAERSGKGTLYFAVIEEDTAAALDQSEEASSTDLTEESRREVSGRVADLGLVRTAEAVEEYRMQFMGATFDGLEGRKVTLDVDVKDNRLNTVAVAVPDTGELFASWVAGDGFIFGGSENPYVGLTTGFGVGPEWQPVWDSDLVVSLRARYQRDPDFDAGLEPAHVCAPHVTTLPGYEVVTQQSLFTQGLNLNVERVSKVEFERLPTARSTVDYLELVDESLKDAAQAEIARREQRIYWQTTPHTANSDGVTGAAIVKERTDTIFAGGGGQTVYYSYGEPLVAAPMHLNRVNNVHGQTVTARRYIGDLQPGDIPPQQMESVQIEQQYQFDGYSIRLVDEVSNVFCDFVITRTERDQNGTEVTFITHQTVSSTDSPLSGVTVFSDSSSSAGGTETLQAEETDVRSFNVSFRLRW